jgi:hypothetical protein
MRLFALAMVCLSGCGGPGSTGDQAFKLEGECDPPNPSREVAPVRGVTLHCDLQTPEVAQIESQAELDSALGPLCAIDTPIDFTQQQVLIVRGYPTSTGLSAAVNFLRDDGVARTIGILHKPTGFPFPDEAMIVPRTKLPLKVSSCREVCTSGCDRAIP